MVWNGYPILYGDTGGYLKSAMERTVNAYRPSGYPLVMALAAATHRIWPVAALQALVMAYLFVTLARVDLQLRARPTLILVLATAASTTLPWWTISALSDIWCGAVAVSAYLLLFRWPRLGLVERLLLAVLLALALTFHISFPIIMGGTLGAVLLLHLVGRVRIAAPVAARVGIVVLIALGGLFYPLANLLGNRNPSPSTGADLLMLARFAGDGLVLDMLEDRCPEAAFRLCERIPELEATLERQRPSEARQWPSDCSAEGYVNWILVFDPTSPMHQIYLREGADDLKRVMLASLRHDPVHHVGSIIGGTWDLLLNNAINPVIDGRPGPGPYLAELSPSEQEAFNRARARRGKLYTSRFNLWLKPAASAGMLVCLASLVILLVRGQKAGGGQEKLGPFVRNASYFLIFCVINAMVMYSVVGDHTRYQSRCSWMMAMQPLILCLLIVWPRARGEPAKRDAQSHEHRAERA
jgi:hypothetical protein